jgi:hypothetical protein
MLDLIFIFNPLIFIRTGNAVSESPLKPFIPRSTFRNYSAIKVIYIPFNSRRQTPITQIMIVKSTPNAPLAISSILMLSNEFFV